MMDVVEPSNKSDVGGSCAPLPQWIAQPTDTTRIYRFNIARITSVLDKTDVNKNAVAFS